MVIYGFTHNISTLLYSIDMCLHYDPTYDYIATPIFLWLLFLLHASLYNMNGVPVSI